MITKPLIRLTVGSETLEFSGEEVTSATLVEETNIIGMELPISALEAKIMNYDESFSMFSGSYFSLLSERLPVVAYENVDGELQFLGKFYLSEWKNTSEHEFEFRAVDIIGILDATDYDGNFWSADTPLGTVLAQTFVPINVLYTLDESLQSVPIRGWIPPGNYREALQQICLAAGAAAISVRSDRLQIRPVVIPTQHFDYRVRDTDKLMEQSIELQTLVTSIELVSHNYTQGSELEEIFNKELEAGSHKIIFEKPYYNIVVDGPGYDPSYLVTEDEEYIITEAGDQIEVGGEYVFGPNVLYLEMTQSGIITITGYPWLDSKRAYIFRETGITEYANKNALVVDSATLVNMDNAQIILDRVRDYYRQRYRKTITLLPSEITLGDIVLTRTLYQKNILATVQKMSTDLAGGYLAQTELLGIEPAYIEPVDHPARRARSGVATCGADLTRQNMFREYDHE
ncbi:MAG TPA: hypothetical protein PLL88_06650 [Anaerolineaceae bacterium]|nr:hypothetical protein [Anaerolineaceae bacterium]